MTSDIRLKDNSTVDGSASFNAREVMVLECFAKAWVDGDDHSLYGCLSYQDAFDLLAKLGVDAVDSHKLVENGVD